MDPTQRKTSDKIVNPLRHKIHEIIFEADTPAGKAFDIILLWLIGISVAVVMLESVPRINKEYQSLFTIIEWVVTILFTIEYCLRIYSVYRPFVYIFSFYGIVDLLSILPTFLSLFLPGTQYLVTIRALRLLRVFRILKLSNYTSQGNVLLSALRASRTKITVFMMAVMTIVVIMGSAMYLIEGTDPETKFTSIPISIYWAIVTLTTVGYGDISPTTELGQFLSSILMILGYAIIAVPTGIVSSEISKADVVEEEEINTTSCPSCSRYGHDSDATFCKYCGHSL
ncbi:MAG: ion transporter [Bacteroidia bacterium]|nr:ion transporter [Bacteroidia bacterium]